jgi:hypothetical protein
LVYNSNGSGRYEWAGHANFVADGKTVYRLEVAAPSFETVFAEQKMPKKVELTNLKYEPEGSVSPDGDKVDDLTFEFDDPAGEEDYYGLSAYYVYTEIDSFNQPADTFVYSYNMYLESLDPLLEIGASDILLLSDKSFDGQKFKLKTYCYCGFSSTGQSFVVVGHLTHLTREKYLYLRSLNQYQNAHDNPFAEPVTVQSNIEKGVGVFSLESLDTMQVRL